MNHYNFNTTNDDRALAPADAGRLGGALARMQAALANQRAAVADFQRNTERLSQTIGRLRQSMAHYQRALGGINVKPLRAKALHLYRIMDDFEREMDGDQAA